MILELSSDSIQCSNCRLLFKFQDNIPLLFWSNEWNDSRQDITNTMKSFYEENPFPNYEEFDSKWSLKVKARKGVFARLLDDQIPHNAKVLEVGCGTGQLSNFLATKWGRTVYATDMCLNSLKLGQEFKEKNQIDQATFLQMNLFRPVFKPESFDVVICNGVLHHTSDPFLGFQSIANLVKKDGYIIIGLYNKFGRLITDIRRAIFNVFDNRFTFLDSRLRDHDVSNTRKHIWFMDQYKNPHESKHTIGEVQDWFEQSGFEFINCLPKLTITDSFFSDKKLFKKRPKGSLTDRFLVQLETVFRGGREGGFFIMIGRKKF